MGGAGLLQGGRAPRGARGRRRRRREIVSEVRIWCTDRRAQLRFRPYWAFIGPFSRFIGSELLSAATRRAERTSPATD